VGGCWGVGWGLGIWSDGRIKDVTVRASQESRGGEGREKVQRKIQARMPDTLKAGSAPSKQERRGRDNQLGARGTVGGFGD